jgi:hypothetical protein
MLDCGFERGDLLVPTQDIAFDELCIAIVVNGTTTSFTSSVQWTYDPKSSATLLPAASLKSPIVTYALSTTCQNSYRNAM